MRLSLIISIVFVAAGLSAANPWTGEPRTGDWVQTHQRLVKLTADHKTEEQIVFIGDSITNRWQTTGKSLWDKYYVPRHAFDYGIEGDRTENVIYRIEHQEFDGLKPKVVVLKIGTNNISAGNTPADVAKGIQEVIRQLEAKMADTPILLLGVLPRAGTADTKVHETNALIAKFADNKKVYFLDMASHFETAPGQVIKDLYIQDQLHLELKGYQVWHDVMEPLLTKILNQH